MPRIPSISFRKFTKALKKQGFILHRITGSHHVFIRKTDQLTVSVPYHAGHDVGRGLVHSLLKDIGISLDEFIKLL